MLKGDAEAESQEIMNKIEERKMKAEKLRSQFDSERNNRNELKAERNQLKKLDADRQLENLRWQQQ